MKKFIKKYKYILIAIFIFLHYIPYLIQYYPGLIISDSYSQIKQALGVVETINNKHPVIQTFTWWIFIKIGTFFNNDNLIILLNSIFQMIAMSIIFSYSIYILDKKKIRNFYLIFIYALYPMFGVYSIYTTKDTMFSICILFFILELSKFIDNPEKYFNMKRNVLLLLISGALVILYKNNGIYIVLITMLCLLFLFKKYKKKILKLLSFFVIFVFVWNNVIFRIFNITQTKIVEVLAIPMLQMNNIVYNNGEIMPEKLLEEINNFIDVDILKTMYIEKRSDEIKPYFKEEYYNENKFEFFKLSIELFIKYPKESLQSIWLKNQNLLVSNIDIHKIFLNNKYNMPLDIKNINENKVVNASIFQNEFLTKLFIHPVYELYFLIFMLIYLTIKRNKKIILFIPMGVVWLTTIAAPAAAYRYVFPCVLCNVFLIYKYFDIENRVIFLLSKIMKWFEKN